MCNDVYTCGCENMKKLHVFFVKHDEKIKIKTTKKLVNEMQSYPNTMTVYGVPVLKDVLS